MNAPETVAELGNKFGLALCELLDIDPCQVVDIHLAVEPGVGAVARWTGVQHVSLVDVGRALVATQPDPWEGYDGAESGPAQEGTP